MIAISQEDGKLVRLLSCPAEQGDEHGESGHVSVFGFHPVFGFVSHDAVTGRQRARRAKSLRTRGDWRCQFQRDRSGLRALSGCQLERVAKQSKSQSGNDSAWRLTTEFGTFLVADVAQLSPNGAGAELAFGHRASFREARREDHRLWKSLGIATLLILALFLLLPKHPASVAPEVLPAPIEVKLAPERQKLVHVADLGTTLPRNLARQMTARARVAVAQNLGFLSMLGKKNLTAALGGMPTVRHASPGAGAGGKQGSGGELLVGLGEGVTRTTVGNTGVVGLGGLGTKGAGGGAGGYGTSYVGSGNGRGLSSIPLSQDILLEGGLDRSVIQATIAKYLNEIRACYEDGLRKIPGLVGQVSVAFEISGAGAVSSARVSKSSLGDPEVEQCITQRMLTWQFPRPRGGVNVKVDYPFMLRPVNS